MSDLDAIRTEIRYMDPTLDEKGETFRAAVAMLTAVTRGTHDIPKVASMLGEVRNDVGRWFRALRDNRVFCGRPNDPRFAIEWDDEESGGIAFWCDVAVATGMLTRVPS